jgi:hypothetical protein
MEERKGRRREWVIRAPIVSLSLRIAERKRNKKKKKKQEKEEEKTRREQREIGRLNKRERKCLDVV